MQQQDRPLKRADRIRRGDKIMRGGIDPWLVIETTNKESMRGGGKSIMFRCKDINHGNEIRELTLPSDEMVEVR